MKAEDFIIEHGNEIVNFKRGVVINDRASEVKVVATLNNKKGLYTIASKLDSGQITSNAKIDQATTKLVSDLYGEAVKYCIDWKKEWAENNVSDNDQELPFGEE